MSSIVIMWLIAAGSLAIVVLGVLALLAKFYRQVDQGRALIVNTMRTEPVVTFTGKIVIPIIHRAEVMDISVKTVEIDRRGKEGLICADNIRADIKVAFFVRVNKTVEDVLKVAQAIGCARASDSATIDQLFTAKFSEALKTVGKRLEFEDLYKQREKFRDEIKEVIGRDLNGFVLDDVAIDYLEQTPVSSLDAHNILDAQGIRKITEITANQNVYTNELRQKERMNIGSQNLTADEAVFQFDQRRADAEAKKNKEVQISQAREQNEAQRIADEEHKKTVVLRQKFEEEMLVAEQNKQRAAAIAEKGREREIAVETERVEKARQIEVIARTRDVELGTIAKDKDVEVQKKEIADVIRGRIAVEKTVAEEEERIKDLRLIADSKRKKEAVVIAAQAEADKDLTKQVRQAEATEQVARFEAKKRLTLAEADLEAADKEARAKMRAAEGDQAKAAADGLADVRVREAQAAAIEKQGLAEALIIKEKMQAEAAGLEQKGLADARVREAVAQATQKQGLAEAAVAREKLLAEAAGEEQKGLADARVREAAAVATERQGVADAIAIEKKMHAEAAGLSEKAAAMKALDGVGKDHEEYRLRLDNQRAVALAGIEAKKDMAKSQAEVMSHAMKTAKIQIVGGDGTFFDRFVKAMSFGTGVDATVESSETIKQLVGEYLAGDRSLPADVKDILGDGRLTDESLRNLTLSAFLAKLMTSADPKTQEKLERLLARAKELGIS